MRAQGNNNGGAITQGKRYTLALQSERGGAVTLSTQLNGHSCGIASEFTVGSSTLNISGILPKMGKGYKQVTFSANGVSVPTQLKLPKGKKVRNLSLKAACSQLNSKIQKALISVGIR